MLIPDRATGSYRFRHALIAEAAYATLLPGEREDVHERLARALACDGARAGELAEHWIAARRPEEALTASLEAAREAEAVSGLSEALRHLERVLDLWDHVPRAERGGRRGDAHPARLGRRAGRRERRLPVRRLGVVEARELYPLAVVLESIAIRRSPAFAPAALEALAGGEPAHARRGARPRRGDAGRRRLPCPAHRGLHLRAAARGAAARQARAAALRAAYT